MGGGGGEGVGVFVEIWRENLKLNSGAEISEFSEIGEFRSFGMLLVTLFFRNCYNTILIHLVDDVSQIVLTINKLFDI